jgi:hypothetical protein
VPNGNVLYARPDYFDDPFLPEDDPDGSLARPYPALAPESQANFLNRGDLNAQVNFGTGFNPAFDRNGNGRFDRSVIFAAQQRTALGPVVIVAQPGTQLRNPVTNTIDQATFVLQAPRGGDPIRNDASISVPFNTILAFAAGATVKMQNASIFVQNQGTAIQTLGGPNPNARVTFTSFADDSIGGDSNNNGADTPPLGGDWGGIVLRNFDDATPRPGTFFTPQFPVDVRLRGPGTVRAGLRGRRRPVVDQLRHAALRRRGRAADPGPALRHDHAVQQPPGDHQRHGLRRGAAGRGRLGDPGGDLRRLRLVPRGRHRPRPADPPGRAGQQQHQRHPAPRRGGDHPVAADRRDLYPDNPATLGGARNFVFDDPLPHVLLSQLVLGQALQQNTGGTTTDGRQPALRAARHAGQGPDRRLDLRQRPDGQHQHRRPDLHPRVRRQQQRQPAGLRLPAQHRRRRPADLHHAAGRLGDDHFFDPTTQVRRTIVPANDTNNDGAGTQPVSGLVPFTSRWGTLQLISGAVAVIDEAEFRFGGGSAIIGGTLSTPSRTIPSQSVLSLVGATFTDFFGGQSLGTRASITNNDFFDNFDAPISVEPNGLLAADPLRPCSRATRSSAATSSSATTSTACRCSPIPASRPGTSPTSTPSRSPSAPAGPT